MARKLLSILVLNPTELAALGSVVVESTYAESLVTTLILEMSKLKNDELTLFLRGAMMNTKLELLADLGKLKLRSTRRKAEFASIISRLKTTNSERVIAVHGFWNHTFSGKGTTLGEIASGNVSAIQGPSEATHPRGGKLSATKLDGLAKTISDAYWDLHAFYIAVWVVPFWRRRETLRSKSRGSLLPRA